MSVHANFWWDWPAVVNHRGWNWVDFRVIHLSWEWAKYADYFEVDVGLLGFSVAITISWLKAPAAPREEG